MKKTFKLSLKSGFYFPLALLACCIPATQVNAYQTDDKPVESEQATEESAEPKAADEKAEQTKPEETVAEEAEAEKTPLSVGEQIAQLAKELNVKTTEMKAAFAAAKTTAEKREIIRSSPRAAYADKFLALYEENVGDKDAFPALRHALVAGGRRKAAEPTKILLELADGQDSELAQKSCTTLMLYGDTRTKTVAANKLLELSNQAAKQAEALRATAAKLLLPVASTPLRGQTGLQEEAVESLWALTKTDPESADIGALSAVGFYGDSETSSAAFNAIMKHHLDDEDIGKVLSIVPRTVNPAYETILHAVMKTGEGDDQVQAAISLAKYIPLRDGKLDRSALNDEELADLEKESKSLRELLGSFDGDSELHKKAQDELFVLENLTVGAKAMNIVGTDLEGEEFKLSDYRGKIVFLDFWGDW